MKTRVYEFCLSLFIALTSLLNASAQSARVNEAPQPTPTPNKVLKFEFQFVANAAERKVHRDLTPASKETVKLMNTLAREGFVVRDLLISDEVSVLLERSLQK